MNIYYKIRTLRFSLQMYCTSWCEAFKHGTYDASVEDDLAGGNYIYAVTCLHIQMTRERGCGVSIGNFSDWKSN